MKYSKSLFPENDICYVCGRHGTEIHHVFFGPYRSKSERWGLKVRLCRTHHESIPYGVHGGNRELDLRLKKDAQARFEQRYGHGKFMQEFNRNYLE